MTRHPLPRRGTLSWSAVVDLPQLKTEHDRAAAAADLLSFGSLRRPGCRVTLRVGNLHPVDCGYRVEQFIAEAYAAGVNLHLEGDVLAVGAWWRVLTARADTPPPRERRHLEVVR